MPENMRGTVTSSGSGSVHTSAFIILLYQPCTMVISDYPGPPHRENYACVVALELDLQKVSLYGITDLLPHSTTAKFLPLYTHTRFLSGPQDLATVKGSHCQPYI